MFSPPISTLTLRSSNHQCWTLGIQESSQAILHPERHFCVACGSPGIRCIRRDAISGSRASIRRLRFTLAELVRDTTRWYPNRSSADATTSSPTWVPWSSHPPSQQESILPSPEVPEKDALLGSPFFRFGRPVPLDGSFRLDSPLKTDKKLSG